MRDERKINHLKLVAERKIIIIIIIIGIAVVVAIVVVGAISCSCGRDGGGSCGRGGGGSSGRWCSCLRGGWDEKSRRRSRSGDGNAFSGDRSYLDGL